MQISRYARYSAYINNRKKRSDNAETNVEEQINTRRYVLYIILAM